MITKGSGLRTNNVPGTAAFSGVTQAINTASRLAGAVTTANNVMGAIRSINLPSAGEALGDIEGAISSFGGDANSNDWRVRLSLPSWVSFKNSPVLKPLKDAGGLVFPYTPQITIKGGAKYTSEAPVHSNAQFHAFKNSDPGSIEITAPMNVEDPTQALYWIAAVHYLRSISKMFAGNDPKAGNPPPIVFLNGYGNYVFKNIPVAIQSFSCRLENDCDYIACDVVGSALGAVQGLTDSLGGLADSLGGIPGVSTSLASNLNSVSSALGQVGQVAGLLGSFGVGGTTSGGQAHVPTKSSFTVTLLPMYSRTATRKFSLDRFVQGGYLNNSFGYI